MKRLSGWDAFLLYSETPNVHMHTLKIAVIDLAGLDSEELSLDGNESEWAKVRDQGIAQVRQLLVQSEPCVADAPNRRLKHAFAWIAADIEGRLDALAIARFPVSTLRPVSKLRRFFTYWRKLLRRPGAAVRRHHG